MEITKNTDLANFAWHPKDLQTWSPTPVLTKTEFGHEMALEKASGADFWWKIHSASR